MTASVFTSCNIQVLLLFPSIKESYRKCRNSCKASYLFVCPCPFRSLQVSSSHPHHHRHEKKAGLCRSQRFMLVMPSPLWASPTGPQATGLTRCRSLQMKSCHQFLFWYFHRKLLQNLSTYLLFLFPVRADEMHPTVDLGSRITRARHFKLRAKPQLPDLPVTRFTLSFTIKSSVL